MTKITPEAEKQVQILKSDRYIFLEDEKLERLPFSKVRTEVEIYWSILNKSKIFSGKKS